MTQTCETIRVKASDPEQGEFVVINKSDFDEKLHELHEESAGKPSDGMKVEDLKAALEAKGITIPEGVTKKADLAALLDNAPAA
ncbi:hypothetical protein CY658_05045 [Variovorax sp. RO1]|uniref:hypothetical protein n=1 Tax=Variovorax sp. RO1 TaxID=2066034 RepID=UPI000C717A6F|nr:hypothetical protein [Variovorax sp. RO1]PLC06403.1 hypothetical protein CY658_05045 [Variovorax sp. RO1]